MSDTATLSPPDLEIAARTLAQMAGPDAVLRDDQRQAIALLSEPASRVLLVQATGWGKSAVYWAATAIARARGAGPTLVVSPLLSLMRDQVEAASRAGLRAHTLNSSNYDEWSAIEAELRDGELDVVLVSPERLANPGFGARVLDAVAGRLGLLVIDECHAISDWGHDFRPDYRRVGALLQRLNPQAPVLATTATANERVTADVAAQLGDQTSVLRGQLARRSLQLIVASELSPIERYGWVADRIDELPGSGIVYTLTVDDAQRLTDAIRAVRGTDYPVAAYTGRIDADRRLRLEDALRRNELKALVATSALGMGFDKPDLGFIVHVGAPPSPVSYYQQVGRAGRGIDHAAVVLLPSRADTHIWEYFATSTIPREDDVQTLLHALAESEEALSPVALEARTGLRRTKVELLLKQLAVDDVVRRTEDGWSATGVEWRYDREHYDSVVATRRREADIMRSYAAGADCLMMLLQRSLDDPTAAPCGRCSVCDPAAAGDLLRPVDADVVTAVGGRLRTQGTLLEPRKMWPGPPTSRRGRISSAENAVPGRVLVEYDAPQWATLVREELLCDAPAGEALVTEVVGLLGRWSKGADGYAAWAVRPDVVVDLPCGGLPSLTSTLGDRIASVGRMDRARLDAEAVAAARSRVVGEVLSSPHEAAAWEESIRLVDGDVDGRTVLLIADRESSGWACTMAAAALRRAGATAVLPLLLHRVPAGSDAPSLATQRDRRGAGAREPGTTEAANPDSGEGTSDIPGGGGDAG